MRYLVLFIFLRSCASDDCSVELAKKYLEQKQIKEAMQCYNQLLNTTDSIQVCIDLGNYYWRNAQMDSSIKYYQKVIFSGTAPLYTIINLGDSYYKVGDYLKALNCFLMVERKDSLYPTVNYNISTIYMQKFELYDKALAFALKEYSIDSQKIDNINLIGQLYMNIGSNKKAIYYFSKSLKADSSHYLTYFFRALGYLSDGERELAYADLAKCMSLNSTFVDGLVEKIKVGVQLGKTNVCKDIYELKKLTKEIEIEMISIEKEHCK